MGLQACGLLHAEGHRAFPVVRVYVLLPELRLLQPTAARVAQEPLGLLAHVEEPERRGVRPPQDGSDGIQDVVLLLCRLAQFLLRAPAVAHVADRRERATRRGRRGGIGEPGGNAIALPTSPAITIALRYHTTDSPASGSEKWIADGRDRRAGREHHPPTRVGWGKHDPK